VDLEARAARVKGGRIRGKGDGEKEKGGLKRVVKNTEGKIRAFEGRCSSLYVPEKWQGVTDL